MHYRSRPYDAGPMGGVSYPTILASVSFIAARDDKLYVLVNHGGAGACAFGQSGQGPGTFDAAMIKPIAEGALMTRSGCIGGPGAADPGRVACENVTLKMLLMRAYQAKAQKIIGPAGWMEPILISPRRFRAGRPAMITVHDGLSPLECTLY